jgi:hypothetical protein
MSINYGPAHNDPVPPLTPGPETAIFAPKSVPA